VKILLRRLFPCPSTYRWRWFEALMKECLCELDHEVIEIDLDPTLPPDPPEADFLIYAHKTLREVPRGNLFYKEMHMRGLFTIDHEGWGADHSRLRTAPDLGSTSAADAEAFCSAMRNEFLSNGRSKIDQPALNPIPENVKPYLLAPLQTPGDDVIMYHSPLSIIEYVSALAQWADRRRHNVVFKLHPGQKQPAIEAEVRKWMDASPYVFLLNENIHSLILESQAVVVINSGVGFESLIHGKPVITLGACDYQWVTFRASTSTLDDGLDFAHRFSHEQRLQGFRFIHYYYHQHAYLIGENTPAEVKPRVFEYLREHVRN